MITALGGYYTSTTGHLLLVDDEGIIVSIQPWCNTTTSTTTTTTTLGDVLAGGFTVSNAGGSVSDAIVNISGWGTGGTIPAGENRSYTVSGNIGSTPGYAQFSIFADGGSNHVTVNSENLTCTDASISINGSGTSTVLITITPDNYNGSTDTLSGNITVTITVPSP